MKNIKDFDTYILEEGVGNEIPEDGTYTGWCCSVNLHLDNVGDFKMSIGPRARFDGEFQIKDRDVVLLSGTQHFGGKDYPLKIDDPNGMDIGTFKTWDGEKYV